MVRTPEARSTRSLGGLEQAGWIGIGYGFLVLSGGGADADGGCGFAAEGDLHTVYAVDGRIARGSAADGRHHGVRDKAHVHEVVLDGFGEIESDQDANFADI